MVTRKRGVFVFRTLHWHQSTWTPCRLTHGDPCPFPQLAEYRSANYGSLSFEHLTVIMSQSGLFFKAAVPLYRILRSAQATNVSHIRNWIFIFSIPSTSSWARCSSHNKSSRGPRRSNRFEQADCFKAVCSSPAG